MRLSHVHDLPKQKLHIFIFYIGAIHPRWVNYEHPRIEIEIRLNRTIFPLISETSKRTIEKGKYT